MIHLYINGYDSDDLIDFDLRLSNPSSIAQQQKLELVKMRFEIAGQAPEGLVSKNYIRKNILELSEEQIAEIKRERVKDTDEEKGVEVGSSSGPASAADGGGGGAPAAGGGGDLFGGGAAEAPPAGGEEAGAGGDLFSGAVKTGDLLKTSPRRLSMASESPDEVFVDDIDEIDIAYVKDESENVLPLKPKPGVKGGHGRKGSDNTLLSAVNGKVDLSGMLRSSTKSDRDPYGLKSSSTFEAALRDPMDQFLEKSEFQHTRMTRDAETLLSQMKNRLRLQRKVILREGDESSEGLKLIDLIGTGDDE